MQVIVTQIKSSFNGENDIFYLFSKKGKKKQKKRRINIYKIFKYCLYNAALYNCFDLSDGESHFCLIREKKRSW